MLYLRDIFGQDEAITQLRSAWRAQRLPHGLIFAGPAGVGKGTLATALAAWFLCEHPGEEDACGHCASCHLVSSGTHPDYHVIYRQLIRLEKKDSKARDLSRDLIRDYLLEPASRKPLQGVGKVFVLEEAQTMNRDAANAMLKTLEEPQGRSLIILLTEQAHALLPTIRSRCQMVRFASLPARLVTEKLAGRGIDPTTAEMAATVAEGSLGLAIRWIEDGVIDKTRELQDQLATVIAGRRAENLPAWLAAAAAEYAERQEQRDENISKDQVTREALVLYLRLGTDYLRMRLPDLPDAARQLRVCRMIDDIARAQQYITGNVNTSLVLEHIANRLK